MSLTRIALACALVSLFACQGKKEDAEVKAKQKEAVTAEVPADLKIQVQVDGREVQALDSARLKSLPPDHQHEARRVWLLTSVLPAESKGKIRRVEVEDTKGVRVEFGMPKADENRAPALVASRRGKVTLAMIDPKKPFAEYHGQGNQQGWNKDNLIRLGDLRRIAAFTEELRADAKGEGGKSSTLKVKVKGRPERVWQELDIEKLGKASSVQVEQSHRPSAWMLRPMVESDLGKGARIEWLESRGERKLEISESDWQDGSKVPVLRRNRQGEYRFQWLDKKTRKPLDKGLRGVNAIGVEPGKEAGAAPL